MITFLELVRACDATPLSGMGWMGVELVYTCDSWEILHTPFLTCMDQGPHDGN